MLLQCKFTRTVTAGPTTWTADALPVDTSSNQVPPPANLDCATSVRPGDQNGWPATRMIIAYVGPAGAPTITASLYAFERATQAYHLVQTAVTLTSKQLTYVSIPSPANPPMNSNFQASFAGAVDFILLVTPPGGTPAVGAYVFAMGPDNATN